MTKHISVRLKQRMLDRIEALILVMSTPWRPANRSDVLRAVIVAGLDALEAEHAGKRGRRP